MLYGLQIKNLCAKIKIDIPRRQRLLLFVIAVLLLALPLLAAADSESVHSSVVQIQESVIEGLPVEDLLADSNPDAGHSLSNISVPADELLIGITPFADFVIPPGTQNQNFTVPAGQTWLLQDGTTVNGMITINGTLDMTGGTITGTANRGATVNDGGILEISDGAIAGNSITGTGGGLAVNNGGTVLMSGGSISGNTSTGTGGGAWVSGNRTEFVMTGGIIEDNNSLTEGGGLQITNGATFVMSGDAAIYDNTAGTNGGGVNMPEAGSTLTMSGDSRIEDNTATNGVGGGVRLLSTAQLHMTGGTIVGNTANSGGGVHLGGTSQLHMTAETDPVTEEIISVGAIEDNTARTTSGGGVHVAGTAQFTMNGGAVSGNRANGTGGGIQTNAGFSMSGASRIEGNTSGTGNVTDRGGGGINVGGGHFAMSGGIIAGNSAGTTGGGVHLGAGASLTMSNDAEISRNRANDMGGGGVFGTGAIFTMTDDAILYRNEARNAAPFGGGVRLLGASTFNLEGGEITRNESDNSGGGVNVGGGTNFQMSGGAEISHNSAPRSAGLHGTSTATLEIFDAAQIYGNEASTTGGGVGLEESADLTLSGQAKIRNNIAITNGGGLHASGDSRVTMQGGFIENNQSFNHGGGVMLWVTAQFSLQDGEILDNTTARMGGAVGIPRNTTALFDMTGGAITNNTAGAGGGGIGFTNVTGFAQIDAALNQVSISHTDTVVFGNHAPRHDSEQLRDNHIARIDPVIAGPVNGFNNMDIHTVPLFMVNVIHHFLPNVVLSGTGAFETGDLTAIYRAPAPADNRWSFSHWELYDEEGNSIPIGAGGIALDPEFYDPVEDRWGRAFTMPDYHLTAIARWNIAPPVLTEGSKTASSFTVNAIEPPAGWTTEYRLLDAAGNEISGRGWSTDRSYSDLSPGGTYQVIARFVPNEPGPGPTVIGPSDPLIVQLEEPFLPPTGIGIGASSTALLVVAVAGTITLLTFIFAKRREAELNTLRA